MTYQPFDARGFLAGLKSGGTPANPANPANRDLRGPGLSSFSNFSSGGFPVRDAAPHDLEADGVAGAEWPEPPSPPPTEGVPGGDAKQCQPAPPLGLDAALSDDEAERAAIIEFDAGVPRHRAERQALDDRPAAPTSAEIQAWTARLHGRYRAQGYSEDDAATLAEMRALAWWHVEFAPVPDPGRCAGCGAILHDADPMEALPDGAWVHLGGTFGASCLLAYGRAWRRVARAGLDGASVMPPSADPD